MFHLNPVLPYNGALLEPLLLCAARDTLSRRSSVRTLPGDLFLFTTCRHWSAWNRNSLPLASSVTTARDAYAAADGVRGACTLSSVVYSDTPDAHLVFTNGHCIRARSLHPKFRRDSLRRPCGTLTQPLGCTSTSCRDRRLYRPRKTLAQSWQPLAASVRCASTLVRLRRLCQPRS